MRDLSLFFYLTAILVAISIIGALRFRLYYQKFNKEKLKNIDSLNSLYLPLEASDYNADATHYNKLTRITNIAALIALIINFGGLFTIYKLSPLMFVFTDFLSLIIASLLGLTRFRYVLSMIKRNLWIIEKIPRQSILIRLNDEEKVFLQNIYTKFVIYISIGSLSTILLGAFALYFFTR
ncbi:hypothetical protein [Lacticaseibacillus saniviri]